MQKGVAASVRWRIFALSLGFLAFVIYGSLVPLELNSLSFKQALDLFAELNKGDFSITATNRADWFTNFLLMTPLFYSLLLLQSHQRFGVASLIFAAIVFLLILLVSVGIEFTQLFVDKRISSFKDVYAQAFGMLLVLLIYFPTRASVHAFLLQISSNDRADKWEIYGTVFITLLFIYSLMPFDLSLSMTEIFNKWESGRVSIIPFAELFRNPFQGTLSALVDVAIWVVITFFFIKSAKFRPQKTFFNIVLVALCIELAQLPVLSRYTDVTDVIVAIIGVMIARKLFATADANKTFIESKALLYVMVAFGLYYLLLLGFSTLPVDLVSRKELAIKIANFLSMPFTAYWNDEPFVAITQLVRKVLLFIPIGLMLQHYRRLTQASTPHFVMLTLFVICLVFLLEVLQLVMANKVASISDSLLNLLGVWIGFQAYQYHFSQSSVNVHDIQDGAKEKHKSVNKALDWRIGYVLTLLSFTLVIIILLSLDATPYNVKEVFAEYPQFISALLVSALFTSLFFFPVFLARRCIQLGRCAAVDFIVAIPLFTIVFALGSLIVFPNEALYDIVGFPVWKSLPQWLEMSYRLIALLLPFFSLYIYLVTKHLLAQQIKERSGTILSLLMLFVLFVLPFSYVVTVVQAGTDNLTELMAGQGYSFGLLGFICFPLTLILLSVWTFEGLRSVRVSVKGLTILAVVLSGPFAYWLLQLGFVDYLLKYDRLFTPLQFLLSPDRKNLYSVDRVYYVFLGLHYMLLAIMIACYQLQLRLIGSKVNSFAPDVQWRRSTP